MDLLPTPLRLQILHHLLSSPHYICSIKPQSSPRNSTSQPKTCDTAIFTVSKNWHTLAQRVFFSSNTFIFWDGAWETVTLPPTPRARRRTSYYNCSFTALSDLTLTSAAMHLRYISLTLGYHLASYRRIFEMCLPRLQHLRQVEFNIHCCWGYILEEEDPETYLDVHTGKLYELIEGVCRHVPRVMISRKEFRVEDYHRQYLWVEQMVGWRNLRWKGEGEERAKLSPVVGKRRGTEVGGWGYERLCKRYHVRGKSLE